jgi:hypothetical protein
VGVSVVISSIHGDLEFWRRTLDFSYTRRICPYGIYLFKWAISKSLRKHESLIQYWGKKTLIVYSHPKSKILGDSLTRLFDSVIRD